MSYGRFAISAQIASLQLLLLAVVFVIVFFFFTVNKMPQSLARAYAQ